MLLDLAIGNQARENLVVCMTNAVFSNSIL